MGVVIPLEDGKTGKADIDALLLSFHSFAERAAHFDGKSCAPISILSAILQHHGLVFWNRRLSAYDCGVISKVLEYHNDQVKKIDLSYCGLDDLGMEQLSPGLKTASLQKNPSSRIRTSDLKMPAPPHRRARSPRR
ncbi:MAG: hypothetical protein AAF354_13665 [Pseudomonadota bacterium]